MITLNRVAPSAQEIIRKLMQSNLLFLRSVFGALVLVCVNQNLSEAKTLEGGVKHQELMPSVQEGFRQGQRLDASIFENLNQSNRWVKIPDWMAGSWTIKEETAVFRRNFKTGHSSKIPHRFKARQKFVYGMQKDRQGGIWHYAGVPYKSLAKLSREDEIHLVKDKQYEPFNQSFVRFRSLVNVIRVKRSSQKISKSYQQESITTYTPIEGRSKRINLSASTKSFDENGNPLIRADNEALVRRSKEFEPLDSYKGKDMKALFIEFLTSTGRTNLLP